MRNILTSLLCRSEGLRRQALLALTAAVLLLFVSCGPAGVDTELGGYYAYSNGTYTVAVSRELWDGSDTEYRGFSDAQGFLQYVAEGADRIAELTGEDWLAGYAAGAGGQVVVRIEATDEASHTAGGYASRTVMEPTIFLNSSLFAHGMAPIFHELTHVIC